MHRYFEVSISRFLHKMRDVQKLLGLSLNERAWIFELPAVSSFEISARLQKMSLNTH